MRIEPLGDAAAIVRELGQPAYLVAERINAAPPKGVIEAVASYDTLGIYFDPAVTDQERIEQDLATFRHADTTGQSPRRHVVPVCYELGEDMDLVCRRCDLTEAEVIAVHSGKPYTCFAVGFCPGFPYLGYLDRAIAGLPRKDQPRTRIAPGSIGITGVQTGIYPLPRPGGWQLIGRTPLTIVDPDRGYFPIVAGDEVRFEPISRAQFDALEGQCL